jgi:hypothetical protein
MADRSARGESSMESLVKQFLEFATQLSLPDRVSVLALERLPLEALHERLDRFVSLAADCDCVPRHRGRYIVGEDHTLVLLPRGARAVVYHASGAMRVSGGLAPMEGLFDGLPEKAMLTRQIEQAADVLRLQSWLGPEDRLSFERLWQIKATGADRSGTIAPTVLCRAVGAYRHAIGELPVWGPASAVVQLAGQGQITDVQLQLRPTTGSVIDEVRILSPERAAETAARYVVMSGEIECGPGFQVIIKVNRFAFGYVNLSKRQHQPYLAPAFVADVQTGRDALMNHQVLVPAGDTPYFTPGQGGAEAAALPRRRSEQPRA